VVTDIRIPFVSMVVLMVKWSLAAGAVTRAAREVGRRH